MKLYYSPTSPYVRKVLFTAIELGLRERIEIVPVQVSPVEPSAALNQANPIGKIPALIADDGTELYDSVVICEYLDSLQGARLFPASGPARWGALRQHALADGILDAAVLLRYETWLRPAELRWQEWADGQTGKIERGLDALEAEAAQLAGPVTIGTISAACALGYLDLRHSHLAWRDRHPRIASWLAEFAARPSYQATMPPA